MNFFYIAPSPDTDRTATDPGIRYSACPGIRKKVPLWDCWLLVAGYS